MANLLVIREFQRSKNNTGPSALFEAVESEIRKNYQVYGSRSVAETIHLVQNHLFEAILIISLGADRDFEFFPDWPLQIERLRDQLAGFVTNGGTLILTSRCFNACQASHDPQTRCSMLKTGFALEGHRIDKSICHYVLNQNFKNVFGPSVFVSLDENIRTDAQTIDSLQESEKIYKSVRERSSDCAAAYIKAARGLLDI